MYIYIYIYMYLCIHVYIYIYIYMFCLSSSGALPEHVALGCPGHPAGHPGFFAELGSDRRTKKIHVYI